MMWLIIATVVFALLALLNCWGNGAVNKHSPSQAGKIILITGANTGLGYIAANEISKLGAEKIILACRNEARGEEAVRAIKASS